MNHDKAFVPLAEPDLRGNEERYVVEALRSTWISSTGPFINRFEREFSELCGARATIAVCNGTLGLHVALLAMGLEPGDEVLVPSLTYIATANAVRYCGAEPVFVDIDPMNWCIDPKLLEERVTPRTKGIIPVHLYGHPADMDTINRIAAIHGLWVVEDAAEAHLATYRGRPVGSLAGVGVFSFYGNKILSSGEGGAVTTSDAQLELRIRTLKGQGVDPDRRYYFPVTGYNYRMTNICAAILCAQLERRDVLVRRRHEIIAGYQERLEAVEGIGFQPVAPWALPAPWLTCIRVNARQYGLTRDELADVLRTEGIETRPFFIPLHTLPPFRGAAKTRGDLLPLTEQIAAEGLNLPTFSSLPDAAIDRICEVIRGNRR